MNLANLVHGAPKPYTRRKGQVPPSPSVGELTCSLPSISTLLEGADVSQHLAPIPRIAEPSLYARPPSTAAATTLQPATSVPAPPQQQQQQQQLQLATGLIRNGEWAAVTPAWQLYHYPHSITASPQTYKRYICQACQKAFLRSSSLRIHSHTHTGEKPFRCTHAGCGKAFSVHSSMKRHWRFHCAS